MRRNDNLKFDTNYVIAIDFDNTITIDVEHTDSKVLNIEAKKYLKELQNLGCVLVLWTCRDGYLLKEAKDFLLKNDIKFDYFNEYPLRGCSRKIKADYYIDDKSQFGCVDWNRTIEFIKNDFKKRKSKNMGG